VSTRKIIWITPMKQKIFTIIFFLLFVGVFWYFYGDEYREFYEEKVSYTEQEHIVSQELSDFSLDDVVDVRSSQLVVTPDLEVLESLVQKIDTAQDRVYLEVYIFTEKRIFAAMKRAHERGVDVRAILEKNPYKAPRLNDARFTGLQQSGIQVVWSNANNYSLNHAKFLIIDNEVIISTGNMSYSTFTKNRDFFVFLNDPEILTTFEQIFEYDFQGKLFSPYHENIVLSPRYAREKLTHMILSAEQSIDMYFQYLKDDELLDAILQKARQWIEIRMVLDDDYYEDDFEEVEYLRSQGIQIHKYAKSSMHAKAILVDQKSLFIGSVNFSSYSLDKNREVGVIISDSKMIEIFSSVFHSDFKN